MNKFSKENEELKKLGENIFKNIENLIFQKFSKAEIARRMNIKPQSLRTSIDNIRKGSVTLKTLYKIANAGGLNDYRDLL